MPFRKTRSPQEEDNISLNTLQRSETLPYYNEDIPDASAMPEPAATRYAGQADYTEATTTPGVDDQAAADLEHRQPKKASKFPAVIMGILAGIMFFYMIGISCYLQTVISSKPYQWRSDHPFVTAYAWSSRLFGLACGVALFILEFILECFARRGSGADTYPGNGARAGRITKRWIAWKMLWLMLMIELITVIGALNAQLSLKDGKMMPATEAAEVLRGVTGQVWMGDYTAVWGDAF